MKLKNILSDRHYQNWPSFHIIYEWENEISRALDLPIKDSPIISNNFFIKTFNRIDNKLFNKKIAEFIEKIIQSKAISIYFELYPKQHKWFSNRANVIPITIDFWEKSTVEIFKYMYSDCPYLLITSLEVLNFLQHSGIKNKLIHFPLSLPSIYFLDPNSNIEKSYDIVLAGRTNSVLINYLKQYVASHPDIEYLYQVQEDGEIYYHSNKTNIIKKVHSREDYIKLINAAKVSFYSTAGIDNAIEKKEGFNPVTPRFFELLAAGCHVLARYPENVETTFFELNTICPSITSFTQFEDELEFALKSPPPISRNAQYLSQHYTSTRIDILKKLL